MKSAPFFRPKTFIFSVLAAFFAINLNFSQTIATQAADPSAALEVRSTTQGFLPPRMGTTKREQIKNPAPGLVIYNYDRGALEVHVSEGNWVKLGAASSFYDADKDTGISTEESPDEDQIRFFTSPDGKQSVQRMIVDNAGNVGIGTSTPNAALDINSSDYGLLIPRRSLTTSSTFGLSGTAAESILVYNTNPNDNTLTTGLEGKGFYYWNGSAWKKIASGGQVADTDKDTKITAVDTDGDKTATDHLKFDVAGKERMRIDNEGRIGIGTDDAHDSAILELKSTTKAFLPPRMTTTERNNAFNTTAKRVAGMVIYNTTDNQLQTWNGTSWVAGGGGVSVVSTLPTTNIKKGDAYMVDSDLYIASADGKRDWVLFENDAIYHNGLLYKTVISSGTGKIWLDRNLGATRVATAYNDHLAYGDLYQWGRATDGHEKITWTSSTVGTGTNGETTTQSSSGTPGHDDFIEGSSNWTTLSEANHNVLWRKSDGSKGANDPCPDGFRIPTETELNNERTSWSSYNRAGAFASSLKWPAAGRRDYGDGVVSVEGSNGYYWSSTTAGSYARNLGFSSSGADMNSYNRANGLSVRCIKE